MMQSVKEIVSNPLSPYKGSENTYENVKEQIRKRYGDAVADEYDPYRDCMPFSFWSKAGYRIKPSSKAFKSVTYVDVLNEKGEVEKKIRRIVNLFHKKQVSPTVL
jgi:hypothetical protein